MKLPEGCRADAVITLSGAGESPERAITSVLANARYFCALHIVQEAYSSTRNLYPGWRKDVDQLRAAGLNPVWHIRLDPRQLKSRAVVYIEPDLGVLDSALDTLFADMLQNAHRKSQFAVCSVLSIPYATGDWKRSRAWIDVSAYGFLLVLMMMDTFRWLVNATRYHRTSDLRAQTVATTYPSTSQLVERPRFRWLLWTGVAPTLRGQGSVVQTPSGARDGGWAFVMRTIEKHNHLGLWLSLWPWAFALYYLVFAWPWWNTLLGSTSSASLWTLLVNSPLTASSVWSVTTQALFQRNPTGPVWLAGYLLHGACVALVAHASLNLPMGATPALILLYPFYLALFPLIYVVGRVGRSRAWTEEGGDEPKQRSAAGNDDPPAAPKRVEVE